MTEFELATINYRNAMLGRRYLGNWIAAGVGFGQIVSIWIGFWLMRRTTDQRRTADDQRHAQAITTTDKRHAEAMGMADQRHAEGMAALREQGEALRALIKGMETVSKGLETVIERTAPAPKGISP